MLSYPLCPGLVIGTGEPPLGPVLRLCPNNIPPAAPLRGKANEVHFAPKKALFLAKVTGSTNVRQYQ